MATLKDVAKAAGVSVDTASRVLGGRNKEVWPGAKARAERIREIAARLGFRANAAARATRTGLRHQVGLLLRNSPEVPLHAPTSFEIVLGANLRLQAEGITLVLVRVGDLLDPGGRRALHERMLDGILVVGDVPASVLSLAEETWPAAIWVEGPTWGPTRCLRRDEDAAGRLAVAGLLRGGARRLAWIGPTPLPGQHYSQDERLAGAEAAARDAGMQLERVAADPFPSSPPPDAARLHSLLTAGGTGMVAASYMHACWLAHRAAGLGLTAPRDFRLASCDDDGHAIHIWPDLARVANPRLRMGELAAEMLLAGLADPDAAPPSQRLAGAWIAGTTAGAST